MRFTFIHIGGAFIQKDSADRHFHQYHMGIKPDLVLFVMGAL